MGLFVSFSFYVLWADTDRNGASSSMRGVLLRLLRGELDLKILLE